MIYASKYRKFYDHMNADLMGHSQSSQESADIVVKGVWKGK